nr:RraA family protein [Paenibacillus piri]
MSNEFIDPFQELPTTCISDAMQGLNNMDPRIKPLKETYRVAGRALTVKMPVGDNLTVFRAIREANPGDVLVIDAKGDEYRAVAGDFVVGMAQTLGLKGMIVDGVIRDIEGIKQLGFPVFSRGTAAAASSKAGVGEINVPVSCGGTAVHPGDIVVGDADGVVVVPRALEKTVLKHALEKLNKDKERSEKYLRNSEKLLQYLDETLQSGKA